MFDGNITTVGVIDSGIGGISIVKKLIKFTNVQNIIYFADNEFMPYGNKTKEFVRERIEKISNILFNKFKTEKIIIACNTASTCYNIVDDRIIKMKFDENKTYFATRLTKKNSPNLNIISDLNLANKIEKYIFNDKELDKLIKLNVKKHDLNSLDEYVLGCTHYELVEDKFKKFCPNTKVYSNSDYIIKRNNDIKRNDKNIFVLLSKNNNEYSEKIWKLIKE